MHAAAREQQLRGDSEGEQAGGRGEHLGGDNTYSGLRLQYLQHINKSFKMTFCTIYNRYNAMQFHVDCRVDPGNRKIFLSWMFLQQVNHRVYLQFSCPLCREDNTIKLKSKSQVTTPVLSLLRPGPDVPALLGVGAAVGEGEGGGEVQHALVLGVLQQARAATASQG